MKIYGEFQREKRVPDPLASLPFIVLFSQTHHLALHKQTIKDSRNQKWHYRGIGSFYIVSRLIKISRRYGVEKERESHLTIVIPDNPTQSQNTQEA